MRRVRTNTPLQALTLLNDRAFFEGRAGAGRTRSRNGKAPDGRRRLSRSRFRLGSTQPASPAADRVTGPAASLKIDGRRPRSRSVSRRDQPTAARTLVAAALLNREPPANRLAATWTMVGNVLRQHADEGLGIRRV